MGVRIMTVRRHFHTVEIDLFLHILIRAATKQTRNSGQIVQLNYQFVNGSNGNSRYYKATTTL